jgi:pimeloyl-ACP methyl ester carboxylesterase
MSKPVRRSGKRGRIGQWAGAGVAVAAATVGMIALRHALETPQPLKSQLPGEAQLYRWRKRSVFYKTLGSPDAPPLVVLHAPEIGASAHEMLPILAPLAQTYRVYAPDLPGFGLSDRPALTYSALLYREFCQDFLRDVVQRPATLLASGLSCHYAIAVAANSPDLCSDLILIAPRTLASNEQAFPLRELADVPLVKTLLYPLLSTRPAFLLLSKQQQDKQADFAHFYAQTHQFGAEHAAMARLAGRLTEQTAEPFQTLKQPILMIWGMQALEDQHTLASMQATTALIDPTRQPRGVEIIPQAGLMAHRDQPESVVAAIQRWQSERIAATLSASVESLTTASFQTQTNPVEPAPIMTSEAQQEVHATTEADVPQSPETSPDPIHMKEPEVLSEIKETPTFSDEAAPIAPLPSLSEPESASQATRDESAKPTIIAYCVKCKQKREMLHAQEVTMKNGRRAVRGTCAICGSGIYRIGGLG